PNALAGRPSGQMAAVAPPPPPGAAKQSNGHANGAQADLGWDDEELATNIYDQPQDAGDAVVDDKPDFSRLELATDGAPVPHPSTQKPQNGAARASGPVDFVVPGP